MDPNRLQGKNSLITCAARGMGAASAKSLVLQVADLCRRDLDQIEAQTVADRINDAGNGKTIAAKMDVTKREDNAAAEAATLDAFGWNNVGLFDASLNKKDLANIGCEVISLFPAEDLRIANRY